MGLKNRCECEENENKGHPTLEELSHEFLTCNRMTHKQRLSKTWRRPGDSLADTPTYTLSPRLHKKIFQSVVGVVSSHHRDFWVRSTRKHLSNGSWRIVLRV